MSNIVVVGGGAVGNSIAYFLKSSDPTAQVVVIERDPSYARASSALSAASIRQQFSTALSIQMSQFGIQFLHSVEDVLSVDGSRPSIDLHENGYLFLATQSGDLALREIHALSTSLGADIRLLDVPALNATFPQLNTDDLVAGTYGASGEGWFDGYALTQALRKKARSLGVKYVTAHANGVERSGARVTAVMTSDRQRFGCDFMVNAGGAWSREVASWLDIDLPVYARRRSIFNFRSPVVLGDFPLVIEPNGVYWRTEGDTYICGVGPSPENDHDDLPLDDVDHALFDDVLWPTLAARVSGFESLRVQSAWSGYYEYNVFDRNAIIGPHPAVENCIFANGFSGHGLMQSPATGRGVSELILNGRFTTLDLSSMSFDRVLNNQPIVEKHVY
jgi:glycine/D-amino acid oxidase-like deaminating enzyme